MNASALYEQFQQMHAACSRIYPIAMDYVHDMETNTIFKLPGKSPLINNYRKLTIL